MADLTWTVPEHTKEALARAAIEGFRKAFDSWRSPYEMPGSAVCCHPVAAPGTEIAAIDRLAQTLNEARAHFAEAERLTAANETGPAARARAQGFEATRRAAGLPWPVEGA